jgi:hypothetical protein
MKFIGNFFTCKNGFKTLMNDSSVRGEVLLNLECNNIEISLKYKNSSRYDEILNLSLKSDLNIYIFENEIFKLTLQIISFDININKSIICKYHFKDNSDFGLFDIKRIE